MLLRGSGNERLSAYDGRRDAGSRLIRNGGHRLLRGAARTAGHEDEVKLALIAQAHELLL